MSRIVVALLIVACTVTCPALAEDVVGWRTDWTGKYPDADPPLTWSATENVVWKTPMPSASNSTPILIGDKLLVCSEPSTLVCLNLSDGKVLWQKDNPLLEAFSAEELAKAKAEMERIGVDKVQETIKGLERDLNQVRRDLRKNRDDEALKKKDRDLQEQIAAEKKKFEPVAQYMDPPTHGTNGYTSATPVSDGKHVWVVFGTGVVACYDLDGNRKWITFVEQPKERNGWGFCTSPVLAGDKLFVIIDSLVALNAADGKLVYRVPAQARWGTPTLTTVDGTEILVTAAGDFFRTSDGAKLLGRTVSLEYNQPIVEAGIVYFIQNGGKAYKLPEQVSGDKLEATPLWTTEPKKDRYYASPVIHDGLIYDITQASIFSAIDAATGKVVYEQNLGLGREQAYPSITLAGKHLFVSGSSGTTAVVEPGRTFKEIGRNTLESFRSTPVFRGTRMYVRTLKHVYCIGK
ncbi:MAG: PQQ-binding-like beta-propeller repeat protein [Planctomycetes bacterium]|nr:PQQ-binding-like beta-propeller repeat protein [Planctomycetota bacterium]